ncbi:MAG: helix-turn-helix transcriptional regulator [Ktedonobacteraceae bacterium]|nr:helix-turn-helix transcriptional regulator [Ktedonobacteraceae bacterium]
MVEVINYKYHHGITIKEYRELRRMTQAQLAEVWPKSGGNEQGVNTRYVQDIEYGHKHIEDPHVLRKLAAILDIPLWKFGLSEYDPFHPTVLPGQGRFMYDETLDAVETLIRQMWSLRCAARIVDAEKGVKRLNELFAHFHKNLPPPLRLERRFQLLYVQVQRLNAVTALEGKRYDDAIDIYTKICESAKHMDNASVTAIALKSLGKELERKGEKQEAVSLLEDARDISLGASKLVIAFVHSYLARVYASAGNTLRFERAVNTGLTIASSLNGNDEGKTDFVYSWSPISALLAERSWGYLAVGEPNKTLAMQEEIEHQIERGQDARLYAWIPLDWAKAYQMLGEIEQCVEEAREFYHRVSIMKSPHAISQVDKLLASLEEDGYGDVQAVKDFRSELQEKKHAK